MTGSRHALCSIDAIYLTRTDRAICVREVEDGPDIWLPRSEATIAETGALFDGTPPLRGTIVSVTAPEWLLIEKGLL